MYRSYLCYISNGLYNIKWVPTNGVCAAIYKIITTWLTINGIRIKSYNLNRQIYKANSWLDLSPLISKVISRQDWCGEIQNRFVIQSKNYWCARLAAFRANIYGKIKRKIYIHILHYTRLTCAFYTKIQ